MLVQSCGVSKCPQFYHKLFFQMLPRPYFGSNVSEKGHQFFQKPWILALAKSVGTFIHVSINEIPTINYWKSLESIRNKAKEMIPK